MAEAKTSQEVLEQCKYDYVNSNFKSVYELARTYSINKDSLHGRINRENWEDLRQKKLTELKRKSDKVGVNVWVDRVKARSEKDWEIIDRSIDNIGSEVDPDTMLTSVKARKILDDMVRRAYGLSDSLDLKSGGQSLGESFASALQKLRETDKSPPLTSSDCDRILEAEIVDEDPH